MVIDDISEKHPLITIIIPCRNEEKFIGKCLDSIIANGYHKDKLEVLVVDGMSMDKTRKVVEKYAQQHTFLKLLSNPKKVTPSAMNIGIKASEGDIIIILNAHCFIANDFISKNIEYLNKIKDADCVGGMLNTINENNGIISAAIPMAIDSPFGAGGSRYRTRRDEGFIVDTVPYAAYRRMVFEKIGLIDEELIRDQDEEFNYRLIKYGGKIYYTPLIKSYLYIRPNLKKLGKQHFQYGYWKIRVIRKHKMFSTWRHIVPTMLVFSLAGGAISALFSAIGLYFLILVAGSYLLLTAFFSAKISADKGWKYFFVLPPAFVTIHFSYGLGFLKGIFDFIIFKKHLKKKIEDEALTR